MLQVNATFATRGAASLCALLYKLAQCVRALTNNSSNTRNPLLVAVRNLQLQLSRFPEAAGLQPAILAFAISAPLPPPRHQHCRPCPPDARRARQGRRKNVQRVEASAFAFLDGAIPRRAALSPRSARFSPYKKRLARSGCPVIRRNIKGAPFEVGFERSPQSLPEGAPS